MIDGRAPVEVFDEIDSTILEARRRAERRLQLQLDQVGRRRADGEQHRVAAPRHLDEAGQLVALQRHAGLRVRLRAVPLDERTRHLVGQRYGGDGKTQHGTTQKGLPYNRAASMIASVAPSA